MLIQKASLEQLDCILKIYADARKFMQYTGNPTQWGNSKPSVEQVKLDITNNDLHIVTDSDEILGVFFFRISDDPTYAVIYDGQWLNDRQYGVIHRIAVSSEARGRGVAGFCFNYCYSCISNIKIDTHENNVPMQRALAKHGFVRCGIIHLLNGEKRIAYQKSEE